MVKRRLAVGADRHAIKRAKSASSKSPVSNVVVVVVVVVAIPAAPYPAVAIELVATVFVGRINAVRSGQPALLTLFFKPLLPPTQRFSAARRSLGLLEHLVGLDVVAITWHGLPPTPASPRARTVPPCAPSRPTLRFPGVPKVPSVPSVIREVYGFIVVIVVVVAAAAAISMAGRAASKQAAQRIRLLAPHVSVLPSLLTTNVVAPALGINDATPRAGPTTRRRRASTLRLRLRLRPPQRWRHRARRGCSPSPHVAPPIASTPLVTHAHAIVVVETVAAVRAATSEAIP